MKILQSGVICLLVLSMTFCGKKLRERPIESLSNQERLTLFKSLNNDELRVYFHNLAQPAKEKAGYEMAQEGIRLANQGEYARAYEYMHFANIMLPFKAENNYLMAKICSKIERLKESLEYLQKATAVDQAYARRSVEDEEFRNLRDSDVWRNMVYNISESTLTGQWKGEGEGMYLFLSPNKFYSYHRIVNSIVEDKKTGSWRFETIKIPPKNEIEYRVILTGDINGTYIVKVETIEGFTLYDIVKWNKGERFFPAFKKKNFSGRQQMFSN